MNIVKKINNKDFEFYSIKLPLIIKKNKRNAYISKELEKQHPCFSDRCWWKTKIKYNGKSFVASIAVMDKVKLARYKEENPGKILKFEDNNKKLLVMENDLRIIVILTAIFLLFILSVVFLEIKGKKENKNVPEKIDFNSKMISQNENPIDICSEILKSIAFYNGKITSLNINENMLNININGCFPEDIRVKNLTSSNLIFKNNIPYFSIQNVFKNEEVKESRYDPNKLSEEEFHLQIRNDLLKRNEKILNENINKNCFEFETQNLLTALCDIDEKLENSNCWLKELTITEQNETFFIKIEFIGITNSFNELIKLLIKNYKVFQESRKEKENSIVMTKKNWEKIGEMTDKSFQYEFYKDTEGKIRRIEK